MDKNQPTKDQATTILQSNEVPIETVSSILGHKNISTTQIYAKITKEKRLGNIEKVWTVPWNGCLNQEKKAVIRIYLYE